MMKTTENRRVIDVIKEILTVGGNVDQVAKDIFDSMFGVSEDRVLLVKNRFMRANINNQPMFRFMEDGKWSDWIQLNSPVA